MISLLTTLLSTVGQFGDLVLWALESFSNVIMVAIGAAVTAALALLPSMSDAPTLGTPTWLAWLNWFYPVGDLIAGLTGLISLWVSYLAVRYILRLLRAI